MTQTGRSRVHSHLKLLVGLVVGCAGGLAALAAADDPPQFTPWTAPVNLGTVVNSTSYDACPTISKSGLSLYFRSNRPGGWGGFDIWVAERDSLEDPWEAPVNLGPTINGPSGEYCSAFSPDGHWMVFVSDRPEGGCGSQDLWISHRTNVGPLVNSTRSDFHPTLSFDGTTLIFASERLGGTPTNADLYISTRTKRRGPQ
jgi:hypothetical protein